MPGKLQLAHVQRLINELNRRDSHGGIPHPFTNLFILGQLKQWRADPGYDQEDPAVRDLIERQLLKHRPPPVLRRKAC